MYNKSNWIEVKIFFFRDVQILIETSDCCDISNSTPSDSINTSNTTPSDSINTSNISLNDSDPKNAEGISWIASKICNLLKT